MCHNYRACGLEPGSHNFWALYWACALEPGSHNFWALYWACALEPGSHNFWALQLQLLKHECPRARALQQEKPLIWEACTPQLKSGPCSSQLEKSPCSHKDPTKPKINITKWKKNSLRAACFFPSFIKVKDNKSIPFLKICIYLSQRN